MKGPGTQGGAVLILGLAMLTVLTLLALAAMQGSTLEQRIAGNGIDRVRRQQAAESTLRAVEAQIEATGATGTASTPPAEISTLPWWRDAAGPPWHEADDETAYAIEELGLVRDTLTLGQPRDHRGRDFFGITVHGGNDVGRAVVILHSSYARRR